MAELFCKQGQPARAAAIYRRLVRERPEDSGIKRRLDELEALLASQRESSHGGASMSFREHIQRIVDNVPGAMACTIMGFDGIAIDSYEVGGAELDIPTLLTEYSTIAIQARRSFDAQPQAGGIEELTIRSGNVTAVVRPLTHEFFIAVLLGPKALAGKAGYLMRIVSPVILKELS